MLARNKYLAVLALNLRQSFALPVRTLANALITSIRPFFLFIIYTYTYHTLGGTVLMPLASVLAALALYNVLLMLNLRRVFDVISKDIKSGMFEVAYLRPMSYVLSAACARLGQTISIALTTAAVAFLLYSFFSSGLPETLSIGVVLWGVLLAVLGVVLSGCMYTLIALPALWINDAEPFYYILDKSILILGGAYVPVALFPDWLKYLAEFSPFGAVMAGTRMFDADFLTHASTYAIVQCAWIVILWVAVWVTLRSARRHIAINGG